jgi:hypothetical protein
MKTNGSGKLSGWKSVLCCALLWSAPGMASGVVFDDFSGPGLDNWTITFANTDDTGWSRNFGGGNLNTTGLNAAAVVQWTTVRFVQSFTPLADFSGQIVQSWDQPDGREIERPLLQFRLWASDGGTGTANIIFGLRDAAATPVWGNLRALGFGATEVSVVAPQSGTAVWDFQRTGTQFTLNLNDQVFLQATLSEQFQVYEAEILLQGNHMNHASVGWAWTGTQTIESLTIVPEPAAVGTIAGFVVLGAAFFLRRRSRKG